MASCSKENIQYCEEKGYLTNLASARFGIVGSWAYPDVVGHTEYGENGRVCFLFEPEGFCDNYEITQSGGKFILIYKSEDGYSTSTHIKLLTKSLFEKGDNFLSIIGPHLSPS